MGFLRNATAWMLSTVSTIIPASLLQRDLDQHLGDKDVQQIHSIKDGWGPMEDPHSEIIDVEEATEQLPNFDVSIDDQGKISIQAQTKQQPQTEQNQATAQQPEQAQPAQQQPQTEQSQAAPQPNNEYDYYSGIGY